MGRIGRIHLLELSTGAFSLVREKDEELRPRHIADASVEASVGVHFVDRDVFHEDPSVLVHDLSGFLVGKVRSLERHTFMNVRHDLFGFFSFGRSVLLKRKFPLCLGDAFGTFFQKCRVLDFRPVGKSRKRFDPDIDSDRERIGRKTLFRDVLAGKSDPPFPSRRPENRAGLDLAGDLPMEHNRNDSDLGQAEAVARQVAAAGPLRIRDRGILALPLETRIARILSGFHSPEKGLKRQIDADRHVLERLGIDRLQRSPLSFQGREGSYLVVQGQSSSIPFPGVLSMLKKMIVEPSTLFQLLVQKGFLFPGRIQPILECFSHVVYCISCCTKSQRHALYPHA